MKITIITPVYKVSDFIERCAVSLFEQTYNDIEYIFIDDCSPDDSIDKLNNIVAMYPDRTSDIKIVRHSINYGVAAARNTGLANATGEYIYYVDADDWLEKDAIETMVKQAEATDADIIAVGWYLSFIQNERKMPMPDYTNARCALKAMLGGQMRWNLWLYMIRRNIYRKYDFKYIEGENVGEDMYMLIRLFSRAEIISFIHKPLYHYVRQNSNSITQATPFSQLRKVWGNLSAAVDYLTNNFEDEFADEINYMKLNVKFPLLISSEISSYKEWQNYFKEAHPYIWSNKTQSVRSRVLQILALKKQYWAVKLYNTVVLNLIYGVLYR